MLSFPILLAIPLLPAAFAAGWFGAGSVIPEPVPPQPLAPAFVDIGNIHVRMANRGLPVAYRTGVTLDPNVIGTPSLAWLRDRSLGLIARAAEMPMVHSLPDAGPEAISEAMSSYAPDWMLHVQMLPSDDPALSGIGANQWSKGSGTEQEAEPEGRTPAPAEQLKGDLTAP
ncbi:hypothetical protein [Paracoccus sp. ME4]|uniref:hypothetical protein n=1 Tax=Paracoccus sp. ME4 TaxID=3138066 RepID=UPI00398A8DDA